ncbi:MAG: hypothetical protein AAGC43_17700 [Bacteroidota bacterium]
MIDTKPKAKKKKNWARKGKRKREKIMKTFWCLATMTEYLSLFARNLPGARAQKN